MAADEVGLEFRADFKPKADQRYADDLGGKYELSANEIYQLGFRIARENVRRLIASPQERALVIVGAGHLPILRHLLESAPDIELISLDSVLR